MPSRVARLNSDSIVACIRAYIWFNTTMRMSRQIPRERAGINKHIKMMLVEHVFHTLNFGGRLKIFTLSGDALSNETLLK